MKKLLIIFLCLIGFTACGSDVSKEETKKEEVVKYSVTSSGKSEKKAKEIKNISYNEYKEKLNNKDSFVLVIWRTGCSHCETYEPKVNKLISDYNLEIYGIDTSELSEDEYAVLRNKTFVSGTPTTVYFKEGKTDNKLVGDKSEEDIINFLLKIGYLKEK